MKKYSKSELRSMYKRGIRKINVPSPEGGNYVFTIIELLHAL